jgi:hypothetical protein
MYRIPLTLLTPTLALAPHHGTIGAWLDSLGTGPLPDEAAAFEDKRFKGPFWGLIKRFLSNRLAGGL